MCYEACQTTLKRAPKLKLLVRVALVEPKLLVRVVLVKPKWLGYSNLPSVTGSGLL